MISNNYYDRPDDYSESDDEPLWQPSRKAMGKQSSIDSFMSTIEKRVGAVQLGPISAQPLHPERRKVYAISEVEVEREPVLLASKKVSN